MRDACPPRSAASIRVSASRLALLGSVCRAALLATPPLLALGIGSTGAAEAATTLTGTYGSTVLLSSLGSGNPFVVTAGAAIDTSAGTTDAIYGNGGTAWTVSNAGHVLGGADGVDLLHAQSMVTNGGVITGYQNGVKITGAGAAVANSGAIQSAGTSLGAGNGVLLTNGGSLYNHGSIYGYNHGVSVAGSAATVDNAGLIKATGTSSGAAGIVLYQGGAVLNSGTVTGYAYGVRADGASADVRNSGRIVTGTGSNSVGISLAQGGTVINDSSGLIRGYYEGIRISGAPGYVYNAGAIYSGKLGNAIGVDLKSGGTVVNAAGAIIAGYYRGVQIAGGPGVVYNAGMIYSGHSSSAAGVVLVNGGSVINAHAAAVIYGYFTGVSIAGGSGYVFNAGTIIGQYQRGVGLYAGGTVRNQGTGAVIAGYFAGVAISGGAGTVINHGTILATNTGPGGADGIYLGNGGYVRNSGLVRGYVAGVVAYGAPAVVINSGTIQSTGTSVGLYPAGVFLGGGGAVENLGSTALIRGYYSGVYIAGGPGRVVNSGSIIATGTLAPSFGMVGTYTGATAVKLSDGGYVDNSGLIKGNAGVYILGAAGTVLNRGSIVATGTYTNAQYYPAGVRLAAGGSVINDGYITGQRGVLITGGTGYVYNAGTITSRGHVAGVALESGGLVVNTGQISGQYGVYIGNGTGTVLNDGTIIGSNDNGVALAAGGTVVNYRHGLITGHGGAAIYGGPGTVVNDGTITGTGTMVDTSGVFLGAGGSVFNTGTITGYTGVAVLGGPGQVTDYGVIRGAGTGTLGVGVYFAVAGSTLFNAGSIIGNNGTSVQLTGSNNLLVLDTGSYLGGTAQGGSGTNDAIVLMGSGTANNDFEGFTDLTMAGQAWVLGGTVSAGNATTIAHGRLEIDGSLVSPSVTVASAGNLGGNGTIYGDVTQSGTLSPGGAGFSIGTLTISGGNYTRSGGVYVVDLDGSTSDQLKLVSGAPGTGTAFNSGGTIAVNAAQNTSYGTVTEYTIVQTDGAVAAPTGNITLTHNLPFLIPTLEADPQDVVLVLTRTFGSNQIPGETPNENALGTALDHIGAGGGSDLQGVLGTLATLAPPLAYTALDQLDGEAYADFASVDIRTSQLFSSTVMQQLQMAHAGIGGTLMAERSGNRVQLSSADPLQLQLSQGGAPPPASPWSAWVAGFGTGGHVDGDGNAHSLNYTVGGGGFGADYRLNPNLVVGAGFGYANSNLSANSLSGNGTADSYQLALYGSYARDRWYLDGLLGYAYNDDELKRNIAFPGVSRVAGGKFNADQFLSAIETGYAFPLAAQVKLTPFARMEVTSIDQSSFTESGAGGLDLAVNSQSTTSARLILGGQVDKSFAIGAMQPLDLELRAGWAHEFADVDRPITASFASAAGSGFTVNGARIDRDSAVVGLGVSVPVWGQTALFVRYDGDFGGNFTSHAGSAGIRFSWGAAPSPMPAVAAPPSPPPAPPPAVQQQTFLVFFDFDKSTLTPEGARVVDQAIAQARRGGTARIHVTGYTDTVGSVQYNLALSQRRARTVHDYMVTHGIPDREIETRGLGKENLRVPTADGVREAQNRRVEIVE